MKTAVEIYKLLPKTNCGTCGTSSCMGFAAKLATHQASPDDCPTMTEAARKLLKETSAEKHDSPGTVYEQVLESLQPKIRALDFRTIAGLFGARLIGPDTPGARFFDGTVPRDKREGLRRFRQRAAALDLDPDLQPPLYA